MRRVVITGMGAVTPLGNNVIDTWRALVAGRSGIRRISLFNAESFPTKIAGEVRGADLGRWQKTEGALSRLGRNSLFALEAAAEAVREAKLDPKTGDPARLGVYFGAGDAGFDFHEYASILTDSLEDGSSVDPARYFRESTARLDPKALLEQEPFQIGRAHV